MSIGPKHNYYNRITYTQFLETAVDQMVAEFIQEKVQKNPGDKLEAKFELGRKLAHASDGKWLTRDEIYDRHFGDRPHQRSRAPG